MKTALLLIAHGSREPAANADLFYVMEQVRSRGGYDVVEAAFLELAEPAITKAAQRCVALGAERVILVPYFLSAGVHVQRDLERHKEELAKAHPKTRFALAEPLGRSTLIVDVVLQRAREANVE